MLQFYCNFLGMSVIREVESVAPLTGDHTGIPGAKRKLVFVGIPGDNHMLELVHYVEPLSPDGHLDRHQLGSAHVCFNVKDLSTLYRRLSAKGVRFVTPPIFRNDPLGEKLGICYLHDPEGNLLEFIQRSGGE